MKNTSHPHPSPDHDKEPCGICQSEVTDTGKAIECNKCQTWIHINCNKLTTKQYKHFQDNPDEIFECKNCNKL